MAGSSLPAVAWDMWRASHSTPAAVQVRQQARLERLLRFARQRSPLYHDLFRAVPASSATLADYPPVSKLQLAERFDDWVTDRAVTRAGLTAFMADTSRVGQRYLERYLVWTSSGTTGEPAMLLQDSDALVVYRALTLTRGLLPWLTPWTLSRRLQRGERVASVIATGGFYAAVVMMEVARRRRPRPFNQVRTISASKPISEIVRELNEFQPAELAGYATMLQLLAEEQLAGRLSISPAMVAWGGEWLSPLGRQLLQTAFRCPIREQYGASEFTRVASGCRRGRLHVSADWAVLEPVDESFRPVPPGRASHTVLLTNLANRVQPLIRYDLGDSITVHPDRCACGSPLPSIEVEGRRDDILYLSTPDGKRVPLLPLAVTTPVYDAPGVRRYQIIQSGPATLSLRLEVAPGADRSQVWSIVNDRMRDYLRRGGLSQVELTLAPEPPQLDPKTRKLRQVIAAWECEQAG